MSREKEIRKSFYTALANNIQIPGGSGEKIPVSDGKSETKAKLYILIEDQTAQRNEDFTKMRWNGTMKISICHKQADKYTRDIVDDVCDSIESKLMAGKASENSLPALSGWQLTNLYLADVSYLDFQISDNETICIKYLTYNFIITKI